MLYNIIFISLKLFFKFLIYYNFILYDIILYLNLNKKIKVFNILYS